MFTMRNKSKRKNFLECRRCQTQDAKFVANAGATPFESSAWADSGLRFHHDAGNRGKHFLEFRQDARHKIKIFPMQTTAFQEVCRPDVRSSMFTIMQVIRIRESIFLNV
ncbi:hypothetical protein AVEN_96996-1 [Araneus ventricosus]|uniref:Uncharacterized protein n=1 Tax=Araneus ventricosus TaxID=182803 RepID=A0A4Y2FS80_ARAVE|nr:hypothetical protein AVEN_96996-1 [Araneus ventricosus]